MRIPPLEDIFHCHLSNQREGVSGAWKSLLAATLMCMVFMVSIIELFLITIQLAQERTFYFECKIIFRLLKLLVDILLVV